MKLSMLLALSIVLVACDDDDPNDVIKTRVDPAADFTSFHTFALSAQAPNPDSDASIPNNYTTALSTIDDAVRSELVSRGLSEVTPQQQPDLFVVSLASTQDQQALSWSCVPGYWYGYWWGYNAWSSDPCAWLDPLYVEYTVGTAAVGLVQVSSERVPFGGIMQGVLDESGNASDRVQHDVHEMFKDYPDNQTGSGQ
jgi:hypothetical protein